MFDVNSRIAQTMQSNYQLLQLSGRFQTLIWRPGETVQNLESPESSGRVDSPARNRTVRTFHGSKPVQICVQCLSKLGNGCFTIIILFDGAYFLLAVMVEGDESSRLRMAN